MVEPMFFDVTDPLRKDFSLLLLQAELDSTLWKHFSVEAFQLATQ